MIEKPLLFKAVDGTGLNSNTIYLFGNLHMATYPLLPEWSQQRLLGCDILLHEGADGYVFAGPKFYESLGWKSHDISEISAEDPFVYEDTLALFYKNVKNDENVPALHQVHYTFLVSLLYHLDYFLTGDEIDLWVHKAYAKQQKQIIDLDEDFLADAALETIALETYNNPSIAHLSHKDILIETRNLLNGIRSPENSDFLLEYKQFDLSACINAYLSGISNPDEDDNEEFLTTYLTYRNQKWLRILEKTLDENTNKDILLVVGAAHLPELLAHLIKDGKTIAQVSESTELPLSEELIKELHQFLKFSADYPIPKQNKLKP